MWLVWGAPGGYSSGAMAKTALLLDPIFRKHDPGAGHPESVARYTAITEVLEGAGLPERCLALEPRAALEAELLACHSEEYVDTVRADIAGGSHLLSTGDTHVCEASLEVAMRAAGSVVSAVEKVFSGKADNAFCAVRPPGHHATADRGMGFCIFNNVAVAARHAQAKLGADRVAIVDWDVHHGNGTQDIFYGDGSVFFFSTHQSPWYPGTGAAGETGEGEGEGTTLNAPFAAGSGFAEIGPVFRERFRKAMGDFKPDLVLVSAGFDSRLGDPLGDFTLTDPQFVELTEMLLEVAHKYADGRLVSVLEGGYNTGGLASAVRAHLGALMDA